MNNKRKVSVLYGASVVFSTAVGVGMMSLPVMSAGMWYTLSLLVILLTAIYIISAGSLLLEVNMNYPSGTGIHMMVHDIMGVKHATINDCMMIFNGFILLYAYLTVGSEAIQFYVEKLFEFELNHIASGFLFAAFFGAIFYCPPLIISRFLSFFISLMLLSFVYIAYSLAINVDVSHLNYPVLQTDDSQSLVPYIFIALPYFMAAMGFQQTIPMLRELYNDNATRVLKSILIGIGIVSVLYIIWLSVVFGNQSQAQMLASVSSGESKLENIVDALSRNEDIQSFIFFFIQVAIVTSFIGVAKGLLDYLKDIFVNHFKLTDNYPKIVVIAPPLILSLLFPYGFLIGIGFAGLAGAIWGGIYPALMARKIRKRNEIAEIESEFTFGGVYTPWFTLSFSFLIVLVMILELFNFLPKFPTV